MRHTAKIKNTDQRAVVIFMQIPGKTTHSLIVPTDTLPDRYHQALMEVLQSPEGQQHETLAEVLGRRMFSDTGKTVLQALRDGGYLQPTPVTSVIMSPEPSLAYPLVDVLQKMGRTVPPTVDQSSSPNAVSLAESEKFNQFAANQQVSAAESKRGIANNLLIDAQLLEQEAAKKRNQAYTYCPELAPVTAAPVPQIPYPTESYDLTSTIDGLYNTTSAPVAQTGQASVVAQPAVQFDEQTIISIAKALRDLELTSKKPRAPKTVRKPRVTKSPAPKQQTV